MVGGGEVKVATVEVESVDNMATLPVSRAHGNDVATDKNSAANKEMELKFVQPKPDKRYGRCSFWAIHPFVYGRFLLWRFGFTGFFA